MASIELSSWLLSAAILLVGCCIQTAMGFGMAVLAAPIIMLIEPTWVPYVLTSTALFLSVINACHQRKHIQISLIAPAMLTRIPGTIFGVWVLLAVSVLWLHIIVAIAVLVAVVVSLINIRFEATRSRLSWAGFASGFMGTTTSIGGPPLALVMQYGSPDSVRGNLGLYFAYSCMLSLLSYWVSGLLSKEILILCLSFSPVAIIGFVLGLRLQGWVDRECFRPLLLSLCSVAGIVALTGVVVSWL